MDNQHKHITGYRDLSQDEIDVMNAIKKTGEALRGFLDEVAAFGDTDPRWVAIARTDFQTGLMALTRAVAKPESF